MMQADYDMNTPETGSVARSYQVATKAADTSELRNKSAMREMKGQYDALMKDNERKSHKLDSMVKEIQTIRSSQNAQQVAFFFFWRCVEFLNKCFLLERA